MPTWRTWPLGPLGWGRAPSGLHAGSTQVAQEALAQCSVGERLQPPLVGREPKVRFQAEKVVDNRLRLLPPPEPAERRREETQVGAEVRVVVPSPQAEPHRGLQI